MNPATHLRDTERSTQTIAERGRIAKMSPTTIPQISFKPKASRALNGIALLFDLEGFSRFFNQPDIQTYVPTYLNHVFNAVSIVIGGGVAFWQPDTPTFSPLLAPTHQKFMGDGALYVWIPPPGSEDFAEGFIVTLANRLWNLKKWFPSVSKSSHDTVPVADLPERIRFGLARGTVYELSSADGTSTEYIGFCINLASRLQKYCPELGFIASARLGIPIAKVEQHGYKRVIAKSIRGFPKEVVIVDKGEYAALDLDTKKRLFSEI